MLKYEKETGSRLALEVAPDLPPKELHRRFIPGNVVPPGYSSDDEPIELIVANDYTLKLGEHEIVLGEHEIFLFNALLLLRDRPRTADEIRALGFITQNNNKASVKRDFRAAYEYLEEQLNINGSRPLVSVENPEDWQNGTYFLNPNLVVTDKRREQLATVRTSTPQNRAANFVIELAAREEKRETRKLEGDLYDRIVTLDRVPQVPFAPTGKPIEVAIIDNATLKICDQTVRLGPHERYLFNALMLRRDRESAAADLKSYGFYPSSNASTANSAFYKATQDLMSHLNWPAKAEIIAKIGQKRGSRYVVNPNVTLTDLRTAEELAREVIDAIGGKGRFGQAFQGKEIPNVGNLYSRLIDLDKMPKVALREGLPSVEVTIIDNTTLRIGDQEVRLGPHERYLFNALMLLRDQQSAAGELRSFGFHPGVAQSTANVLFSTTANALIDHLNSAAGTQLLRKIGQRRSTRYIVNPNLVLADIRTDDIRAGEVQDLVARIRSADFSSSEFRELTEEGDLYERIIDIERIPHMELTDGAIELLIDDNTTLRVGGETIRLGPHERYIFNALMLLRGLPASGRELRQFGFFPGAKTGTAYMTFSKSMTSLIDRVNEALGVEALKKIGHGKDMRYAVNPNLVLSDFRTDEDKDRAVIDQPVIRGRKSKYEQAGPRKVTYKGPAVDDGEEIDHYDDTDRRILLITELVQQYKDHPLVAEAIGKLNNGNPITVGPEQPYYRYLGEINQYDLLDHADEIRLFKVMEKGLAAYREQGATVENEQALIDAVIARQIVYVSNLRLVIDHAKQWGFYSRRGMGLLDFVQEGNMGLAEAIDRFDYKRGFKFSTYATWWIRQGISRSDADKSRLIRIPVHMHDHLIKFSKAVRELKAELDRDPNPWEIAYKFGGSVAEVLKLQHYSQLEPASLNALLEDAEKRSPGTVWERGSETIDQIADPNNGIEKAEQEAEDEAVIAELFSKKHELTPKEKFILSFRLGIVVDSLRGTELDFGDGTVLPYDDLVDHMADPEMSGKNTLEEAGEMFGVTRERIRQIEKKGLDKIRANYHRR